MEVILREDIERVGSRGQVVKVADGYARNFLLPKRLAVAATDANRKIVEQERQAHLRREAKQKSEAEDLSKLLTGVTVIIANFTIDRRKVLMDDPIKQLGEFKVPLRLHRVVTAEVTVQVVKEE